MKKSRENSKREPNTNLRQTRVRTMNLTLGNEEEGRERIEERKSEQDEEEEERDYQNEWADSTLQNNRIMAFESDQDVINEEPQNFEHQDHVLRSSNTEEIN